MFVNDGEEPSGKRYRPYVVEYKGGLHVGAGRHCGMSILLQVSFDLQYMLIGPSKEKPGSQLNLRIYPGKKVGLFGINIKCFVVW